MDGFDLTRFQEGGEEHDKVKSTFGKLISGKEGYETIIEKKKDIKRCTECNWALQGGEKFCPECGTKCQ